jgi:hypothetical protein
MSLAAAVASVLAACSSESGVATGAEEIPFVAGQGSAADLKIAKDGILVDTIRAVDWPNSSVGCPKPGIAYLDVITPGHKITLRADGQIHVAHEAKGRAFICHQTKAYAGIDPKMRFVFGAQMLVAQKDLAERLQVSPKDIKAVSAEETTWDDAALGCPEPGNTYAPGEVTGWVMKLRHKNRDFTYHTDLQRTIPCPAIAAE